MKLFVKCVLFFAIIALVVSINRPEPFMNSTGCDVYTGATNFICKYGWLLAFLFFVLYVAIRLGVEYSNKSYARQYYT
jgi:preprotein translocase subunit SecG